MRWLVLCIVEGVYEQNSTVKNVRVDDWTVEKAINASKTTLPIRIIASSKDPLIYIGFPCKLVSQILEYQFPYAPPPPVKQNYTTNSIFSLSVNFLVCRCVFL